MATATPSGPNVDWTWPLRAPILTGSRNTSPPLELQLLPPASFTTTESPWGLDPSRLQQLMMGSAPGASPASNISSTCGSVRDLGALFDDNSASQPLPSGWERCLDLQSGEMFLKKCDAAAKVLQTPCNPQPEHGKDWKQSRTENGRWPEVLATADEHRQDWSCKWQGEMTSTSQHEGIQSNNSASASLGHESDAHSFPDREPLCLDLDLRLTNQKRCTASLEAQDVASPHPPSAVAAINRNCVQEPIQPWKWEQCPETGGEKPANIQEMAKESTMVTAVCSKCLMYVLLRKSCPICPRCSVPIMLDGVLTSSSLSRKRPRFELSSDVLSLSTDSSR